MSQQRGGRGRAAALVSGRALVALVSAAALVACGIAWSRISRLTESVNTTDVIAQVGATKDAPPADDGAEDILLVGSDTRTDQQGRPLTAQQLRELRTEANSGLNTDTIILVRVPHDGSRSYAVSIPRDTYVRIADGRSDKINSAYGVSRYAEENRLRAAGETDRAVLERKADQAGQATLVRTVQNLTGVRVDHYAEISLYGFYLLTQALGGVEVCLNRATTDPDSGANFRAGVQTVSGGDAVAFVRQRKNLPRGDLDRIVRQQVFLASAMRKVLSAGTLTNSGKLNALADAVRDSVVTDAGFNLIDLVEQAQSLATGAVSFVTIPVTSGNAHNSRGQSIVSVDVPAVRAFVAKLVHAPVSKSPMSTPNDVRPGPPPSTTHRFGGLPYLRTAPGPRCVD